MFSQPLRILALFALVCLGLFGIRASAQDSMDNQPHIQPRKDEKEKRPAKPAPQPSDEQSGTGAQPPDQKSVQTPSASPVAPSLDDEPQGESSSRDSLIDLNAAPATRKVTIAPENYPYDPHRAVKDIEVGNFYLKQKNYRAALDRFHDALLYKPNDAEATYGLAVTQEKLELWDEAYKTYSKYLEILPRGPMAPDSKQALARIDSKTGAHFDTPVVAGQEKQASEYMRDGEKFLANNQYDQARDQFEHAMRLDTQDPVIYFRLAQSLQGMQRLDPARQYYKKYLEMQPSGPMAADAKRNIAEIKAMLGQ
ncbi:MAG TPA: tetratricopeptide repeat protein [Candidatus Limnocylindrales bacterium]|jgi:tetratricopeptide (TPR) repeat protein|nr:tetratricopeptide repeat protein [Candidatus Limnocylindrales bacterium]